MAAKVLSFGLCLQVVVGLCIVAVSHCPPVAPQLSMQSSSNRANVNLAGSKEAKVFSLGN